VPSYNGEDATCEPCDARCLRCTGPTSSDCIVCKQYKVYADGQSMDSEQRVIIIVEYDLFLQLIFS